MYLQVLWQLIILILSFNNFKIYVKEISSIYGTVLYIILYIQPEDGF
jgi:hypothetical protein